MVRGLELAKRVSNEAQSRGGVTSMPFVCVKGSNYCCGDQSPSIKPMCCSRRVKSGQGE